MKRLFFITFLFQLTNVVAGGILSMAEHGVLKQNGKENGKGDITFVPDAKVNNERRKKGNGGLCTIKQWHVIGAEFQKPKAHRPEELILTGGVGHYNVGMLRPYAGIPIFMGVGNEQPRLVGMTDANGKFAIRVPNSRQEKGEQLYLYFSGSISVQKIWIAAPGSKGRLVIPHLEVGSITERYKVTLPKTVKP